MLQKPHIPASFNMYLVINKWVIAISVSNFSGQYLRNHWTLDIGVLGYIGIVWPKEHSPEVWSVPPVTPSISKLQPTRCNFSWFIYFYRRSTCFRRFLLPSSGAQNCTYSFRYCQPVLLLATIHPSKQAAVLVDNTWSGLYSFVLLMMGEGTAWNMWSICRNK